MCKKAVSWILAVLMVFGCVSATAETAKQEKVYVTAGADGTVTSVTDSIRLENPDGLETIEDRTMLSGIENMGGNEAFSLDGEIVRKNEFTIEICPGALRFVVPAEPAAAEDDVPPAEEAKTAAEQEPATV